MNADSKPLARVYGFFSTRRRILFLSTLIVIAVAAVFSKKMHLSENIRTLLPDNGSEAAEAFSLLDAMPFSQKIAISLKSGPETPRESLEKTVQFLVENMRMPYFKGAAAGPEIPIGGDFFPRLMETLPNLLTASDLKRIDAALTPEAVRFRLVDLHRKLLSPSGILEKTLFRSDPFGLLSYGLEKLAQANPFPDLGISRGALMGENGKNALILAETPIAGTDFRNGKLLLKHLEGLLRSHVPPEIQAEFISTHRYTVANAEVMQSDIWRVIGISSALILGLFLIFLPNRQAGFVFLVPATSLTVASATTALCFSEVSAVTLGFGAVLLGISVDFALHVYFAVAYGKHGVGGILQEISRPMLFSALTTISALCVLLFSELPGQRQLAVFAVAGLVWAWIISLLVLPHLLGPFSKSPAAFTHLFRAPTPTAGKWIVRIWLLLLILAGSGIPYLKFNGDLGALNRIPKAVMDAETKIHNTWGDFRKTAVILVSETTLDAVLHTNERLFHWLKEQGTVRNPISIAGILPSKTMQESNRRRWEAYWKKGNGLQHLEFLKAEAESLGFSSAAFDPFFKSLDRSPATLTPDILAANGFSSLLESFLTSTPQGFTIATLVPDTPGVFFEFARIRSALPGVRLISQSRFRNLISSAIQRDFRDFLLRALAVVILLAALMFRKIKYLAPALIPVISGTILMAGGMAWLQWEFNVMNIAAAILVIGLSIDYGIFMVCRLAEGYSHQTERAVLVSGLTTLAGFAALAAARHPALSSIGVTVVLGICAAIPSALWVVPAIFRKFTEAH